jgi:hypothetical protein
MAALAALLFLPGCATEGAKPPVNTTQFNFESTAKFALMDSRAQTSVTCTGLQESKTAEGRFQVGANLRNRENRRIEVQVQCLFKDAQAFALDETPWQTLILTENGQETVRFVSMNANAADYEVRVRSSR